MSFVLQKVSQTNLFHENHLIWLCHVIRVIQDMILVIAETLMTMQQVLIAVFKSLLQFQIATVTPYKITDARH